MAKYWGHLSPGGRGTGPASSPHRRMISHGGGVRQKAPDTWHVPGSQPPFSMIPDPDQNKEDASFISVVDYGVYITLLRPIQFCLLPNQNFEKNVQDPQILWNTGCKIRVGFSRFSWGSNHFIDEIPCHITHYSMDNQAQYSEVP